MDSVLEESDEFSQQSTEFLAWLQRAGVLISPKIELADLRSRSAGRGVLAKKDIYEEEELFSIPRAIILRVANSRLPLAIRSSIEDPWLSLILAMIYEYNLGPESARKPYFDILPSSFDTLMYWTPHELTSLEGSAVVDKIGKASADEVFHSQLIPTIRQHADDFHAIDLTNDQLVSLCHRMGSTIMAYAFDLEDPNTASQNEEEGWEEDSDEGTVQAKGMIPLADMLNADADRNNAKLFYEDDRVVMKSIQPIKAGEEVLNDYGPLPNSDVLRRYGYVSANYAKYDVVEISLSLIQEVAKDHTKIPDKELEARIEYIDSQGMLEDGYDVPRANTGDDQFSENLSVLLNALTMPKADFDKMKKKEKLPKLNLSNDSANLLYSILVRRRSMYPDHDEQKDVTSSRRQEMAAQVIAGEKQVSREAATAVQGLLTDGTKRKADTFEEDAAAISNKSKKDSTS